MLKIICRSLLILFVIQCGIGVLYAQNEQIINFGETKIHYQTFGEGIPTLILNGGPGMSSEGFIPLAKKLAKNYQTIIYDQRGTGLSTVNTIDRRTITMDLMVEDIEALRKHLGYDEWIVMGHSFGGMLAYYYASRYPESISSMIQSSSGGMDLALLSSLNITDGLTEIQRDSLAYYTAKIRNGDNSYETLLKRGEFLAPAYLYNQKYVSVVAKRLTQGTSLINSLVCLNLRKIEYDTKNDLKSFNKSVLILHGAQDVAGTDIAETAHRVLPNSRLVILQRCRHYGWLDRPEKFFRAIEEFLLAHNKIN